MTPEQKARQKIDQQLDQCGWVVQDYRQMDISAGRGVAVREFPLSTGEADYLLYADAKAIGVIEAKPEDHTLTGVELQSAKYTTGLPKGLPHYHLPLPFAYESTGVETRFTNGLDPDARSREVFTFHRPEELIRMAMLGSQPRANLRQMPELVTNGLWNVQVEAIRNLEVSLADNRPRAVIQMATGSGKTFTAVTDSYRFIKFGKAKRILFLVDRNTLGKQALNEFQQYVSPYNNYKFTEEYTVQRLQRNTIDPASKVCITTIQRLYSILKGEEVFEEENEEISLFEAATSLVKESLPVVYNPKVPIETFDFIIIDECHRSIYNVWRQVLEYFDAFLIGLTATPTAQTIGFFNGNLVQDYSHEKAVVDGVNVGYDVYGQVKELAEAVKRPPVAAPLERLWSAYEAVEPEKVKGHGGRQLVDVVALVRHALDPNSPLVPVGMTVEERYGQWLARQAEAGVTFTAEQRKWLDAIKNHIASSLHIEQDNFDDLPFNQMGGLGRAYELFGDGLSGILEALNEGLAA
jgi:type I restriction enzyme R subunit